MVNELEAREKANDDASRIEEQEKADRDEDTNREKGDKAAHDQQ
jgi:hypothetical protein